MDNHSLLILSVGIIMTVLFVTSSSIKESFSNQLDSSFETIPVAPPVPFVTLTNELVLQQANGVLVRAGNNLIRVAGSSFTNNGGAGTSLNQIQFYNEGKLTAAFDTTGLFVNALNVTGASVIGGTMNVTGASVIGGTMNVKGSTSVDGALNVKGATTLYNSITVTGVAAATNAIVSSGVIRGSEIRADQNSGSGQIYGFGLNAGAGGISCSTININGTSSNSIYCGNVDTFNPAGANNLMIRSWWGIGFQSYDGRVTGGFDTRSGNLQISGSLNSNQLVTKGIYAFNDGGANWAPSNTPPSNVNFIFARGWPGKYADGISLNTWPDSSGGNSNLLLLSKNGIGMRIYQQAFGSPNFYSGSYADAVLQNSSGNVNISNRLEVLGRGSSFGGASNSGVLNIINPNGTNTHFGWTDGRNYIRGNTVIDGAMELNGVTTLNGAMAFNGTITLPINNRIYLYNYGVGNFASIHADSSGFIIFKKNDDKTIMAITNNGIEINGTITSTTITSLQTQINTLKSSTVSNVTKLVLETGKSGYNSIAVGEIDTFNPFGNNNLMIKSWWGIGFQSYDNIVRGGFDTRTGNLTCKSIGIGYYQGRYPLEINDANNPDLNNKTLFFYRDNGDPDGTNIPFKADGRSDYGMNLLYNGGTFRNWPLNGQEPRYIRTSIYARGQLLCGAVTCFSDIRIKKNIQDLSSKTSLEQIRKLSPAVYQFIDTKNGNMPKIGFIAQDVEKVIDISVKPEVDFIPNIYQCSTVQYDPLGTILILDKEITTGFEKDSVLRVYLDETLTDKEVTILKSSSKMIQIKEQIENVERVFLYGTRVDDKKTLDHDVIFTVGISAIQELDKIIQTQQEQIQSQEERIQSQEERIQSQEERIQSQEERIRKLENLFFQQNNYA